MANHIDVLCLVVFTQLGKSDALMPICEYIQVEDQFAALRKWQARQTIHSSWPSDTIRNNNVCLTHKGVCSSVVRSQGADTIHIGGQFLKLT